MWPPRGTASILPSTTGSRDGFLFSVPQQMEGLSQVQGGVVERQTMDGRPEVQHVPLDPAIGVEALKGVLPQMDGEGSLRVSGLAVDGARTTALVAAAAQLRHQTEVLEHLFHSHLLTQECIVHLGPGGCGRRWRRLDG